MKVNFISRAMKDMILILLLFTALYQSIELWFEDYSGHNFFYAFFPSTNHSYTIETYALSTPAEIIVNYGNKKFSRHFPSFDTAALESALRTAAKNLIQNGQFLSVGEVDWDSLLTAKSILYSYHFQIPVNDFLHSLSIPLSSNSTVKELDSFDTLLFSLSTGLPADLEFTLINTAENIAYKIGTQKNNTNKTALDAIDRFQKEYSAGANYISTVQQFRSSGIFSQNLFVPQFPSKTTMMPALHFSFPLQNASGQQIEEFVAHFFDNPSIKDSAIDKVNRVYRFSDQNVVVKYYPIGVLTYNNYDTSGGGESRDLYLSYAAAYDFISRDSTLQNAVTLHDAQFNGDSWTFYFNYNLNNFDVFLSTREYALYGISSLIEITTSGQMIKSYKRLVVTASSDYHKMTEVATDFLDVLNSIVEQNAAADNIVDALYLGYRIDASMDGSLFWRVRLNGGWFSEQAQVAE